MSVEELIAFLEALPDKHRRVIVCVRDGETVTAIDPADAEFVLIK